MCRVQPYPLFRVAMALSMIYVVIEQMSLAVGSAVTVAMCVVYNPTPLLQVAMALSMIYEFGC